MCVCLRMIPNYIVIIDDEAGMIDGNEEMKKKRAENKIVIIIK